MFAGHAGDAMRKPSPLKTADGTAYLSRALDVIDQRWGSVEAYLEKEAGVGPAELAQLRAAYLD
jgi:protein-tyrosine phosphatase